MHKLTLTLLLILGKFALVFSQDTIHSEAFQYYEFLTKQGIEVSLKVNKLSNFLTEYTEIAKKCDGFKLDKDRFDTANNLFQETAIIVNKGIFSIIQRKEVDADLSLKEPVLNLLKGYNKILSDYFPVFLSALKTGVKDYSEHQIVNVNNTYNNLIASLQEINKQAEVIGAVSNKFKIKYNFTEYDVMKNGL